MAMTPVKKIVANVGKYTDRNGQEKNRYVTCGKLLKRDDGSLCAKIDGLPVGGEWNGWLNFYDIDDTQRPAQQAPAPVAQVAPAAGGFVDDDVPFAPLEKDWFI